MTQRQDPFSLSVQDLEALARAASEGYSKASPWPHAVFDDFLPENIAENLLEVFPDSKSDCWLDWRVRDTIHQPRKQGIGHASNLESAHDYVKQTINLLNSYPFLRFLEVLTGIRALIPDPYLNGGGLHQILPEGKLAVHTDFNYLEELGLYRRINVLLYLNKDWHKEYNGYLEMWTKDMTGCKKEIAPLFNRMVVFNTTKRSFHGHPKPLNTPSNITRKSIALYYYTSAPAPQEVYDGKTDWQES